MSTLTIKISEKGDALIATLQKEIFNRRRKKVTAQGVVETLVESGAKSQSDKRYAASWKNLIKDIEKAAKVSEVHGNKPANISSEEWALILAHRTRKASTAKKATTKKAVGKKPAAKKATPKKTSSTATSRMANATAGRPARRARKARKAPEVEVVETD